MTTASIGRLLEKVSEAEDRLSELVTALWKAANPTQDEIEGARDVLANRHDNYNPTDLEVLRLILKGRGIMIILSDGAWDKLWQHFSKLRETLPKSVRNSHEFRDFTLELEKLRMGVEFNRGKEL